MLPDDIVLKNCYYWAARFCSRHIEFDALVSVGYIVGKPLNNPRLLKDWLRFTMLGYVINENKHRQQTIKDFEGMMSKTSHKSIYVDRELILHEHLVKADLTKTELICIQHCFPEGMGQVDVADLLKITSQTVNFHIKNALRKLKIMYEREEE